MNDIKKSIEVLKEQIIKNEKILDGLPEKARAGATDLSNVVKACHVAISALEKQMARSPVNRCATFLIAECPRCNGTVSFHHKHCHWCGQNLDWEVENE